MKKELLKFALLPAALALPLPVNAQEEAGGEVIIAADPYQYPDGAVISLTGTVAAVFPDHFTLDFEAGAINVDTEDYEGDVMEALELGDRVTVEGRIDEDLLDEKELEAIRIELES